MLTSALRPFDREMATWHGRVRSPMFTTNTQIAGAPLAVSLPGSEAEVVEQPTAEELRAALQPKHTQSQGSANAHGRGTHIRAACAPVGGQEAVRTPPPRSNTEEGLPEALRAGSTSGGDPWHGTIRHGTAAHLAMCLDAFGQRTSAPHLALDCLAQVKLRCLFKRTRQLVNVGMGPRVRATMRCHEGNDAVQALGREVLGRLAGKTAPPWT